MVAYGYVVHHLLWFVGVVPMINLAINVLYEAYPLVFVAIFCCVPVFFFCCWRVTFDVVNHLFVVVFGCGPHDKPKL